LAKNSLPHLTILPFSSNTLTKSQALRGLGVSLRPAHTAVNHDRVGEPTDLLSILIVDDDPDACAILSLALEASGAYDVTVAQSAAEALDAMKSRHEPFNGVFLDIRMPKITGFELCSIIRSTSGYSNVPIIMITGMTEQSYLQAAYVVGADDYIEKPYDLREIPARFSRARKKRAHLVDGPVGHSSNGRAVLSVVQGASI
jgi:DNA-binding response OmpR family regulator